LSAETALSASLARPGEEPLAALRRYALLDAARGVALCAMVVFHCAFDLDTLGLAELNVDGAAGWRWFARLIAGSFLALAGVSLVIAHANGFRPAAYWRRLAILVGAAALVTLATWYMMPEQFIFFGILHSIAVASLVGLAFLRLPAPLTLLAAALVLAGPRFLASPALDAPALTWLGLGARLPVTLDFEPVFPWLAPFLAGMAIAQFGLAGFSRTSLAAWKPSAWIGRALAFAGRHSLAIYLIHQPVMFGTLTLVAAGLAGGSAIPPEDRPFIEACQKACLDHGSTGKACANYCLCTAGELKKAGLWESVIADRYTPEIRQRLAVAMQACAPTR
jgi:uncharacterized membrane protein